MTEDCEITIGKEIQNMYLDPGTGSYFIQIAICVQCLLPVVGVYFAWHSAKYAYHRFVLKINLPAPVFSIVFTCGSTLLYVIAISNILSGEGATIGDYLMFAILLPALYLGTFFGAFAIFGNKTPPTYGGTLRL